MTSTQGFATELMALLIAGSKDRKEINIASHNRAVRLRFRLNQLRKAMRISKHPQASVVEGTMVRIVRVAKDWNNEEDGWLVIVEPVDDDFAEAIRAAGVDPDEEMPLDFELDISPLPEPAAGTPAIPKQEPLVDYFARLTK